MPGKRNPHIIGYALVNAGLGAIPMPAVGFAAGGGGAGQVVP